MVPRAGTPAYPPLFIMATAVTIDRVTKAFGSGTGRTIAVDDLSLEIRPGELFFLLGPSGCGKTTLLRMIAGFIPPSSGRVLIAGRDVTRVAANRRNTGMVFQSYALWPHMTVEANVAFGLDVRRVPGPDRTRRVAEVLETVRMAAYAKRFPNELSGGQQQRVSLARALVVRPDVLLLDEPLSNLDSKLRADLRSEIRRICKEYPDPRGHPGITTIYVTHDQKEAMSMADRIAVLDRGRVVQLGTSTRLYRQPATRFVAEFLGETNIIEGRLIERSGETAIVDTPLGRLISGLQPTGDVAAQTASAPGAKVLCSVRPEAIQLCASGHQTSTTNRLQGRIVETTFLGDLAQHLIEVNGLRLKISKLNPNITSGNSTSIADTCCFVDPRDVVLLPGN
jgi:iron(III) transport system ATP-binding protein